MMPLAMLCSEHGCSFRQLNFKLAKYLMQSSCWKWSSKDELKDYGTPKEVCPPQERCPVLFLFFGLDLDSKSFHKFLELFVYLVVRWVSLWVSLWSPPWGALP